MTTPRDRTVSRRLAIRAAASSVVAWPAIASASCVGQDDEAEIEAVRAESRKAGIGELGVSRNDQYLAVGDAPKSFRERALEVVLGLSRDFQKHFAERGFRLTKPPGRMTLVTLSDRRSFAAYLGVPESSQVGGFYDLDTNRLAMYDFRAADGDVEAARTNTLVLFHEATHQLSFNTGLLSRDSDLPLVIGEGIGTYGEVRGLNGKPKFGDVNARRLGALLTINEGRKVRATLPPSRDFIADDERLKAPETQQIGYSEAWLLVHFLMKTPARLPKFRDYLSALIENRDPKRRVALWEDHMGDPAKLDRDLAAYLRKLSP